MVTRNDIKDLLRKIKLDYPKFSLPREEQRALEMVESWFESLNAAKDRQHLFSAYKGWKDHESETPTISDIRQRVFSSSRQGGKVLTHRMFSEYAEAQGLKVYSNGSTASAMRDEDSVEWKGQVYPLLDFCSDALGPRVVKDQYRAFAHKHTNGQSFTAVLAACARNPKVAEAYREFKKHLARIAVEHADKHGLRYQEGA